jgi:hypothetical protein
LISSQPEPVDEAQARPFIEKYLLKERQKERVAQEIQTLRAAAKVEYFGNFKAPALAAPPSASPENDVRSGIASGIK